MTVALTPLADSDKRSPYIVEQKVVNLSLTGTTTETTLKEVTIPALGPDDMVRVSALYSFSATANNKTIRIRLNGTAFFGLNVAASNGVAQVLMMIRNAGATNAQTAMPGNTTGGLGVSSSALVTGAVDTSVPTTLAFQGTLAVGTETFTLVGYTVEVVPG